METAHRTTRCQVHMHPAATPSRIFEVRRLARDAGCQYATSALRRPAGHSSTGPLWGAA